MTRRPLVLALSVVTALGLAACAGDATDTAGLPTADELGAEDAPDASGLCVEDEPDCEDTIDPAAGSCLVGDPNCTDESYGGQDVARPVTLVMDIQEETTPARYGATSGATGAVIEQAALIDEDTVRLVVIGSACSLVEDVLVTEADEQVRVLVLLGQDATVDACEDEGLWLTVDIDLAAPLGDRTLLDLAG